MKKRLRFLLGIFLFYSLCVAGQSNKPSNRSHLIDSLRNVLNSLASQGEFQTTIQGQSLGIDIDTLRIKILNKLAWEFKNNNTDTAVILSNEALALAMNYVGYSSSSAQTQKKVRNDIYQLIGKCYVQLGAFYNVKDEYQLALDYNIKALELFTEMEKDTLLNPPARILERKSVILGNMGAIYTDQGNFPKALDTHFEALKASELLGNKSLIATKLINIGNVYHYTKEHQKALEYYVKTLTIAEEINDKGKIATSLSNIGITYRYLHEYTKALANHEKALEIDMELENDEGVARHYINIAGVYYDTKDYVNTLITDQKALEVYEKLKSKSGIATSLGNIGSTQILLNQYSEAEKNLQKALAISTEINALILMKEHRQFLFELYQKSGQPVKALLHYKEYTALKDSIFNEENTKKTVRSEMNFEFEKQQAIAKSEQEKLNAIALKEKQKQQIILVFVSCFLILVAVFAGFMYKRWRITQRQKAIIEKQKEKIVDSINYAQFIQESILPEETDIQKHLPDSFIYFQPKDIVSGDFYWFSKIVRSPETEVGSQNSTNSELPASDFQPNNTELLIIAAVDCTGHGVPGAFMSMIGNTLLNQIVNEKHITKPSEILASLNQGVYDVLHPEKGTTRSRDGMDIALCCIDYKNRQIQYAGARNPLYVISDNELTVINADKQTIGGSERLGRKNDNLQINYTNHTLPFKENTSIYMFSDGYADQFGGKGTTKFGSRQFKELLLSIRQLDMKKQKEVIKNTHKEWKGTTQQIDDILIVGFRL